MQRPKRIRIRDRKLLDKVKLGKCLVCRNPVTDPCHIRSRGAGGDDTDSNLIALCRACHSEQHTLGWRKFCERHPRVQEVLKEKGWVIDNNGKVLKEDT